ncbi:MAG TPA: TlpA disulfide reductase family protein [Anaerolineales bacterium]|nr:TlpA disulfide reductase family protein [Anaerolineales bacterium]
MRFPKPASRFLARRQQAGAAPRSAFALAIMGVGLILAGTATWLLWPRASFAETQLEQLSAVPVRVQFPAPALTLRDLSGNTASLTDFLGQVVLVNLWATWCPPCKQEMPVFQAFYGAHRSRGFALLAINDGESVEIVEQFVVARGITFPVWLDPAYEASEHAFRTANLPTSYVIDREGTVRWMWIGAIDKANLDKYLKPMLEE